MNYDITKQDLAEVNKAIDNVLESKNILEQILDIIDFLIKNNANIELIKNAFTFVIIEQLEFSIEQLYEEYNDLLEKLDTDTEELRKYYGG